MKNKIILWHEIGLTAILLSMYLDIHTVSFIVSGHITVYLIVRLAGFSCSVCSILYTREYYIYYWCQRRKMLGTQQSLDCSSAILGGINTKVIGVLHSYFAKLLLLYMNLCKIEYVLFIWKNCTQTNLVFPQTILICIHQRWWGRTVLSTHLLHHPISTKVIEWYVSVYLIISYVCTR